MHQNGAPRIAHEAVIQEIILSHADERRCKRNFPRKLRGWSWTYYAVELQGIGNEDPYIALLSSLAPIELMASIALIPSHSPPILPLFFSSAHNLQLLISPITPIPFSSSCNFQPLGLLWYYRPPSIFITIQKVRGDKEERRGREWKLEGEEGSWKL